MDDIAKRRESWPRAHPGHLAQYRVTTLCIAAHLHSARCLRRHSWCCDGCETPCRGSSVDSAHRSDTIADRAHDGAAAAADVNAPKSSLWGQAETQGAMSDEAASRGALCRTRRDAKGETKPAPLIGASSPLQNARSRLHPHTHSTGQRTANLTTTSPSVPQPSPANTIPPVARCPRRRPCQHRAYPPLPPATLQIVRKRFGATHISWTRDRGR
jgi:hypothetical protein